MTRTGCIQKVLDNFEYTRTCDPANSAPTSIGDEEHDEDHDEDHDEEHDIYEQCYDDMTEAFERTPHEGHLTYEVMIHRPMIQFIRQKKRVDRRNAARERTKARKQARKNDQLANHLPPSERSHLPSREEEMDVDEKIAKRQLYHSTIAEQNIFHPCYDSFRADLNKAHYTGGITLFQTKVHRPMMGFIRRMRRADQRQALVQKRLELQNNKEQIRIDEREADKVLARKQLQAARKQARKQAARTGAE